MSTKGTVRFDKFLTDLSLAYPVGNLIGEIVAPLTPVENMSDKIFVDADDAINQTNDEAEDVKSTEIDFNTGDPYAYRSTRKALNTVLTDKKRNNASKPINLEMRETNKLTHRLKLMHEVRVRNILSNPAKITQNVNIDATADARWDESTPDLEERIIVAVKTIWENTGVAANTIVIPFAAALYAANMKFIKDTLKYKYGMEIVTSQFQNQVMQLVGLPPIIKGLRVVISNGRLGDSNKGKAKSVVGTWGKDCLIGYVPPNPSVDSMFGILTPEYDSRKVSKERVNDPKGEKILVEWDYDILEAELNCWYLMRNVIG